jgi:DNA-binding CsgD family transcriptional regulator
LAVLQHLAQRQHLSTVAEQLGLAVPTARTYLRRAQEKPLLLPSAAG